MDQLLMAGQSDRGSTSIVLCAAEQPEQNTWRWLVSVAFPLRNAPERARLRCLCTSGPKLRDRQEGPCCTPAKAKAEAIVTTPLKKVGKASTKRVRAAKGPLKLKHASSTRTSQKNL